IGLIGVPGMGKSRLLAELRPRFRAQGMAYCEGQCLAYGSAIPYLPIIELLRQHCGISEDDRPEALAVKVRRALEHSGLDPEAELPVLLDLLGVPVEADRPHECSADTRRARTLRALC